MGDVLNLFGSLSGFIVDSANPTADMTDVAATGIYGVHQVIQIQPVG